MDNEFAVLVFCFHTDDFSIFIHQNIHHFGFCSDFYTFAGDEILDVVRQGRSTFGGGVTLCKMKSSHWIQSKAHDGRVFMLHRIHQPLRGDHSGIHEPVHKIVIRIHAFFIGSILALFPKLHPGSFRIFNAFGSLELGVCGGNPSTRQCSGWRDPKKRLHSLRRTAFIYQVHRFGCGQHHSYTESSCKEVPF